LSKNTASEKIFKVYHKAKMSESLSLEVEHVGYFCKEMLNSCEDNEYEKEILI
jgi:hypothetical protein